MVGVVKTSARAGWIASVAALCALLTSVAEGQGFNVVITEGSEAATPIAVVPFGWQGSGPPAFDIAGVVGNDLSSSGRFKPMATRDMVSRPTQQTQVDFNQWRQAEVNYLVIGTLAEGTVDAFTATFQLFDVVQGRSLTSFRLEAARADLRRAAHRVSDMIFEEITGFPGVFSTQIAYVSEERRADGSRQFRLIVSDADGENANKVAESTQPLLSPSWSPDARRIAYVSFEGGVSGVYVQTLRSGTRERVSARAGVNSAPAFSPDGRMLALVLSRDTGNLDLHTLDLSTQVLRQITTDAGIDTEPAWSPDGRTIYFNSDRSGGPQIYRVGTEAGQRATRITFDCVYCARPRVSPDGKLVALVNGENNRYSIAVWDIAAQQLTVLTDGRLDESPSFAPNGAQIIYAATENGRGVLASVSTDGRFKTQIASVAGNVREPVWGPFPRP
ncbi:MAG TPA: Tol-Pal system beta propeller repeat protein TolB [Gammaproteobacteria bacterium]|nr:Tol-Pal system beta propeller repeat protein TolB [Gammaproteobacteria bacterium]